ncbi:MAG: hypothetical protein ACTSRP_03365 [Candidatus Helarchaeota archaeon]
MKESQNKMERYIQTDITSFCYKIRDDKISLIKPNSIQKEQLIKLKKIIDTKRIKNKIYIDNEWQKNLSNDWKPFENNKYYISNDHCMVAGNLIDLESLINSRNISNSFFQILSEIHNLDVISKLIIKKKDIKSVKFNNYYYSFDSLKKSYFILEKPINIYQNEDGLLICINNIAFVLIAPQ